MIKTENDHEKIVAIILHTKARNQGMILKNKIKNYLLIQIIPQKIRSNYHELTSTKHHHLQLEAHLWNYFFLIILV